MRLVYINPNSTSAMTDSVVSVAQSVLPDTEIIGLTNRTAPPSIQGRDDGIAAEPGLISLIETADADAIVIACFDDTGLVRARQAARCPVIGIGQSAYVMAGLLGHRFSVVTSLDVSIPVIRSNIDAFGHTGACVSIRASGLPVLTIEDGSNATRQRLATEILRARQEDGADAVILGCAGMSALAPDLAERTGVPLIDGVVASAHLAQSLANYRKAG